MARRIARYRLALARRRLEGVWASRAAPPPLADTPAVTLLVTSCDNRGPLELTLRTALAHTDYPNLRLWIADNGSTDSTASFLESFAPGVPVTTTVRRQPQHAWYDEALRTVETPYWIALHEDLIFTGRDWVRDLIARMEAQPSLDLLGGERFPAQRDIPEPFGSRIDLEESLSTWIFCVRTSLRERIDVSFAFHKAGRSPESGREVCYDQGGWLIARMRERGLGFDAMPAAFGRKWYHVGNLTWGRQEGSDPGFRAFKEWQARDVARLARRLG